VDYGRTSGKTLDFPSPKSYGPVPIDIESAPVGTGSVRTAHQSDRGSGRTARVEISVDANDLRLTGPSRRKFLELVGLGVPVAAALAACSSSSPSKGGAASGGGATSAATTGGSAPAASGGSTKATYWFLSGQPQQKIRENAVKVFDAAKPGGTISYTEFQNDAYKTKIKTAIGAGQSPTIIWGWGGGGLRTYVKDGVVEDLTSWFAQNAAVKNRLFPSSFGAATINGKIYAMPCETVQPIVLYWNKKIFADAKLSPPQSWGDILDLVPKLKAKGVAPISLGGQSLWTNMMWLEFLFDRTGGPEVFQAVFNGEKNAWSNPAAIKALTECQTLIKAGGFVKGFASITADSNADQALLYTGRAAMMLHGSWTYGSMKSDGGKFVSGGDLGWMNFPGVDGGKGDPTNTVGNPGQYLSISSKASAEQKALAKKFFQTGVLTDAESKAWIQTGGVPIVKNAASLLTASSDATFLKFIYDVSSKAKVFAQSWDQALPPTAAAKLLDTIGSLFGLKISPQQFASTMNAVIGT
jgi:raffinose/stachyose/melibiose transport system substrate-binding protein